MIHYSAWLARRWHDPAFPKAFPWFAEPRYWEQHYRILEEQLAAVSSRRSSSRSTAVGCDRPRYLVIIRGWLADTTLD